MEIATRFQEAVAASKTLSEKPSNEILLQLYSLYKQATEGDAPSEYAGGPFDFVARAKYDAWKEQAGKGKEAAMEDYIALVERLKG